MHRIVFILLILVASAYVLGCGGSNGDSNGDPSLVTVRIEDDEVSPENVIVAVNGRVQWLNVSNQPRQVVSGTLDPQGSPLVEHVITIGNTGFTPDFLEVDLGETTRFSNQTLSTFTLDIVDTDGQLVSRLNILPGELKQFTFPSAGKFFFRRSGSPSFEGTIILFGQPNPSNQFQSQILGNGGTFTAQFAIPEFIPYFILDVNNPNRSFITGSVRIQ